MRSQFRSQFRSPRLLTALLVVAWGCSPNATSERDDPLTEACSPFEQRSCACGDGVQSMSVCVADGSGFSACQCTPSTPTTPVPTTPVPTTPVPTTPAPSASAPPGSGTPPASAGDGFSCDVRRIVQTNCLGCHGATPKFGASLVLANAAAFQALSGGQSIGKRALTRIGDDARPMPPPPNARLADGDLSTLRTWIEQGSPAQTCNQAAAPTVPPPVEATPPSDPDVKCYSIVARASAQGSKYQVPTTPDQYQCFSYAPPWGAKKVQLVSARPIIDNDQVLHHWILYNNTGNVTDGSVGGCSGAHPDAANVAGWAPGGEPMVLPADVGLRVESGGFTLEVHYNNSLGAGQLDASGAEVCVTEKLRKNEAAVHWLGTQNLNRLSAAGTCDPANQGEVTILASTPHMHLQGRHMKTVIQRAGGGTETLIDKPFDFNNQVSYSTPAKVRAGDTLTTTCTYAAPTPFGQGTNEEMCYNFVLAYPAGDLAQSFQLLRKYDCTGF